MKEQLLAQQQPNFVTHADSMHARMDDFLNSLDVASSSKSTYRRQLLEFLRWLEKAGHNSPTREHILAYRDFLKHDRQLAAFTIGGYLTAVRRFFEWLESIKVYPNIAKGVKGPKKRQGFKKDPLSVTQVKQLLASIDRTTLVGKRDFALINLMIRTGLRTIEVARATKEDISFNGGQSVLWIQGKGRDSKDELVLLTDHTLGPVLAYWAARKPGKEPCGNNQ